MAYFRRMLQRDIYLCIGGNLGDREANMEEVLSFIEFNFGTIVAMSPIVESAGWEMTDVPPFLNRIVHIQSELSNKELIEEMHDLDEFYGRTKSTEGYQSREMDLDILLIDDETLESEELTVPHPRMHQRRFVLQPFAQLYPELMHPVFQKSMIQLLSECTDAGAVTSLPA